MHIWNLLIQTSIPRPCYDAKDLFTVSLCFEDFKKARDKMRSILCELPTQNNAMFDGKGRIKFFNEYVNRLASETEGTNEGSQEARLTKKNLTDIQDSLLAIFSWRDTVPPLKEGIRYSDRTLTAQLSDIKENMPYFGYGYIKSADEVVPFVPINFYAFRIMVGMGCLLILFFAVILFFLYRKDIASAPKWLYVSGLVMIPLSYIASECGWLVAEFGRQPWTIQDMLPTWVGVSDINAGSVALTFILFLFLFTLMLAVEISILLKQIKTGPEYTN